MANAITTLIRSRAGDAPVRLGLILGSGLGHLGQAVQGVAIPYADLPGFPHVGVSGHTPMLTIGDLEGVRVAVFGAREHYYENGNPAAMRLPLTVLKALGATDLIVTNAAGSMRPDIGPGDLMLLCDHINYNGLNPLIGEKTDARFVPLTDAHDLGLRAGLKAAAGALGIPLPEGVYCWYSGPSFETPAEIRMLKMLGGDRWACRRCPK
jgi:purine-nucleoside phosphorylase